eukprot:TRINITY_DN1342_c0_g2_i1.p1 TRINITY_DN1342_c0_g2~~TRINITY_DN1342_c0_g2_i1.p1  ORF type:complete len:547 (-),score=60.03 TRINITY_DN1342_c0_g2_i1:262-1902(-)
MAPCGVGCGVSLAFRRHLAILMFIVSILHTVSVNGRDIRVPGDYSTLQQAVDASAISGDSIYVDPSITTSELRITAPMQQLSIIGDGGTPIINKVTFAPPSGNVESISFSNFRFASLSSFSYTFDSKYSYGVNSLSFVGCIFSARSTVTPPAVISSDLVKRSLYVSNSQCDLQAPFIKSSTTSTIQSASFLDSEFKGDCSSSVKTDYYSKNVTTIDFKNNFILRKPSSSKLYEYYYLTFEAAVIQWTGNRLVVVDSYSTNVDLSVLATSYANISYNYIEADYLDVASSYATYSIVRNVFRDSYGLFRIRSSAYSNLVVDARFNWWPKGTLPLSALESSSFASFLNYFPWYLNSSVSGFSDDNHLSQPCSADCSLTNCNFVDGSCDLSKGKDSPGILILSIGVPLIVTAMLLSSCCCRVRLREYNRRVYCRLAGVPFLRERERDRLINAAAGVPAAHDVNEPAPWIEEGMNPKIIGNSYKIESPKLAPSSELDATTACLQCGEAKREYLCVPCGHFCLCSSCADGVEDKRICPFCGKKIRHVQRVFL